VIKFLCTIKLRMIWGWSQGGVLYHIWCEQKRKAIVSKRKVTVSKRKVTILKRKAIKPAATPAGPYVMSSRHPPAHLCSNSWSSSLAPILTKIRGMIYHLILMMQSNFGVTWMIIWGVIMERIQLYTRKMVVYHLILLQSVHKFVRR
jgi:hypothetical protein